MSARLIPPMSPFTEPYWEAAAKGELLIQKCSACQHVQLPPRKHCENCGSADVAWVASSGNGVIYTFTVARRPPHPVFAEQVPLVVAVVELEEGVKLMTNIIECDPDDVAIGMSVKVAFEPVDDSEVVLPVFSPA